ncbi:MAG TPA: DUF2283 domain-containing protein [Nocardioides sp.]|nr:DUF2283 domain-containing protein [Nocardioides sp.]
MSSPRVEYDPEADAAYIYLVEEILSGGVARTISMDPREGMVNIDLDSDGRIGGIEVMDARRMLPPDLLRQ